ncbi:Chloroperoxidase [Amylostereum chailletii]|nr:Chloroperoxidase [Amylostereum chailletii]
MHFTTGGDIAKRRAIFSSLPPSETHQYIPPTSQDSRCPCPALNTLANHGYLPRSGRNITPSALASALHLAFGLTHALAYFLAYVGFFIQLGAHPFGPREVSLDDFARHGRIEHDASLVHADAGKDVLYAPSNVDRDMLANFLEGPKEGKRISLEDVARARVFREHESGQLDSLHGVIARGEMALVLGLFGSKPAKGELVGDIPVELLEEWWTEERFPEGWAPGRKQGLVKTVRTSAAMASAMRRLRNGS